MIKSLINTETAQLQELHGGTYRDLGVLNPSQAASKRDEFVTMGDVLRIQKMIDAESIRKHRDDGCSVVLWVEELQKEGSLLAFKGTRQPPPPNSGLALDTFVLCIQTPGQRSIFTKYATSFCAIDATHNVTQYANTNLFTVLVRDEHGHGRRRVVYRA